LKQETGKKNQLKKDPKNNLSQHAKSAILVMRSL
jgi:hypothetical protein